MTKNHFQSHEIASITADFDQKKGIIIKFCNPIGLTVGTEANQIHRNAPRC